MNLDYYQHLRKRIFYSGVASAIALSLGLWGCTEGEPAAIVSLQVALANEPVEANSWCQAANTASQDEPFGFQRLRFYRDALNIEDRYYLIGCITNNTGYVVESLPASYSIRYSPYSNRISSGFSSFELPTLQPGQTGFFKTKFEIDATAIGIQIDLQRHIQGRFLQYEPVKRLVIQRQ